MKYILSDEETINLNDKTLRRIVYLKAIEKHNIEAGSLGGFLEGYHNLSFDGDCVVLDQATVFDYARVYGDAIVKDCSIVCGNATVSGNSIVSEFTVVSGDTKIDNLANISGDLFLFDAPQILNTTKIIQNRNKEKDDTITILGFNHTFTISNYGVLVSNSTVSRHFNIDEWEEDAEQYLIDLGYDQITASSVKLVVSILN